MRTRLLRVVGYGLAVASISVLVGGHLLASVQATAPEIDGSSAAAALGLLAGGILILRSRRRLK